MKSSERCEYFCTQQGSSNGIPCICPNNPLFQMIQSQSIRPGTDFHIFEHSVSTSSTHRCSLDAGESGIPVSPEEDPWKRNPKVTVSIDAWLFLWVKATIYYTLCNLYFFIDPQKKGLLDLIIFNVYVCTCQCYYTAKHSNHIHNAVVIVCINTDNGSDVCPATAPAIQSNPQHLWHAFKWEAICFIMAFFSRLIEAWTWKPSLMWPLTRVLLQPGKQHLSGPPWSTKSAGTKEKKRELKLKSHSDDNETVLGRSILVQINSLIHLIRPFLINDLLLEWIQVIRLELLPWTGNAPLGTKSTH